MAKQEKKKNNPETQGGEPQMEQSVQPLDGADAQVSELRSMLESANQRADEAEKKSAENFEGWQRERADFNNFRKRIERDQAQAASNLTGDIAKKYLVVLDDLERALKARPTDGEGAKWAEGIELIYRKLVTILEAEGVMRIPAEGDFDPNIHEAITQEDSADHQSGQIIEVVQQGYKIGERVLRPALVRVAR